MQRLVALAVVGWMGMAGSAIVATAAEPSPVIERQTVLTSEGPFHWSQSRPAVIPGEPPRILITTQQAEKRGSHGYRDLYVLETKDLGASWSAPRRIDSLARKVSDDGVEMVMGDVCPRWHAATQTVLATGKSFGFKVNAKQDESKDDRTYERVTYATYSPAQDVWGPLSFLDLPATDHEGLPMIEANAGCNQRCDLPDGTVLLPIRYRKQAKSRVYTTIVARCRFDGERLKYIEHGSELNIPTPRGLYEPSVCGFQGKFYLTMRAEKMAYVARSDDGINYEPIVEWTFDDGLPIGSYNTQQQWISRADKLYLVYTRRGANNDHVFRHRAPLFMAEVDPERLCLLRETEVVLLNENGLDLGAGFASVDVGDHETWVVSSEVSFPAERRDEPNRILLAKIRWASP